MVCIYILPISGGFFPNQLALISVLSETKHSLQMKKSPDVCIGSSGGNISAYISLANSWNETRIKAYISKIKMHMFIESWLPILPTFLAFPFTGSFFRSGNGIESVLQNSFNSASIQSCEIWTGTYNNNYNKSHLFCNKEKNTTILSPTNDELSSIGSLSPMYLNGNVKLITKVLQASAAIPVLINPIKIDNNFHADGGVMFPSPVVMLKHSIRRYLLENPNEKLQLNYINCYNLEPGEKSQFLSQVESIFHGIVIMERELCISLFLEFCPKYEVKEYTSDVSFFEKIKDKHYLLICYPIYNNQINITNFDYKDILSCFDSTRKNFKILVYVGI